MPREELSPSRRTFLGASALGTAGALAGCATVPRVSSALPAALADASATARNLAKPQGGVLVVLSYPARVTADAQALVRKNYSTAVVKDAGIEPYPAAFDNMLAKTAYHVGEFYSELASRFPPGQVVLQPAVFGRVNPAPGVEGWAYRIPGQHLPTALRVDFMAYCAPSLGMGGRPDIAQTMGRDFAPIVAVSTDPAAAPGTRGALAGLDQLPVWPSAPRRQPSVLAQIMAEATNNKGIQVPKTSRRPASAAQYTTFPLVNFDIDQKEWAPHAAAPQAVPSPMAARLAPYAAVVAEIAGSLDIETALRAQRRAYRAGYDARAADGTDPGRASLTDRFAQAEAEFLHQANRTMIEDLYRGEFGTSMRSRIEAERAYQDRASRTQTLGALMMIAGAAAGAAAGGNASTMLGNALTPAGAAVDQTEQASLGLASSHQAAMSGLAARQTSVAVDLAGSSQRVQARSLAELRAQLADLYRAMFPDAAPAAG